MESLESYLSSSAAKEKPAEPVDAAPAQDRDSVWIDTPPLEYLPNGQPLRMTLRRRMVIAELFGNEWGAVSIPFLLPVAEIVLYLAAHEKAVWERPVRGADGETKPLFRNPELLAAAARDWTDETFSADPSVNPVRVCVLAASLWDYHESTRVGVEKKTSPLTHPDPSPTSLSSGSGSHPEETSPSGTISSTTSPSGTSTPPSTPGSAPAASRASARGTRRARSKTSIAGSPLSGSDAV